MPSVNIYSSLNFMISIKEKIISWQKDDAYECVFWYSCSALPGKGSMGKHKVSHQCEYIDAYADQSCLVLRRGSVGILAGVQNPSS